jgi:hypothetical protein
MRASSASAFFLVVAERSSAIFLLLALGADAIEASDAILP